AKGGPRGAELDVEIERVDGGAGHDAGNDERQEKQRVERLAPGKRPAREHEARGYAEREPADHCRDAHLEAGDEPADEIVLVEDVSEPAQRVALRGERHDLVGEEAQPADEEYRRQDDRVACRGGAEQRDAADPPGIDDWRARRSKPLRGGYRLARHQPTKRFLWKRPAFMITDRFSPWPDSNSSFLI